jgi:hypothetical protein
VAAGPSCCCLFCVCVSWLSSAWQLKQNKSKADHTVRHFNYKGGEGFPGNPPVEKSPPRLIPPPKKPTPSQPTPRKKSPFPPTTLKKPTIFPVPTHQKIAPFPQSEPQKRQKRFNRRRSRSAEQIVMIFTSNYSSQQSWLHPPWTDKIFVKKNTKPTNCPKKRTKTQSQ